MSDPPKSFADIFNSGCWEGQQKFTDRTLQANDGTTFRIHRIILTQRSGYFKALFDFSFYQEAVDIKSIDRKTLESILVYIYTGTIALDEENVCDMMIASDYLLLDDLLKTCESFAIQNMTSVNCLPILTAVSKIAKSTIFNDCYRYVLIHFKYILKTSNDGLQELPFEILVKLLESKSLNVISEVSAWEAIISWTEANSSKRLLHVPDLLSCLRLQEEIDEELVAEILSHNIVSNNPHIFGLVLSYEFDFYRIKCTELSQQASLNSLSQNVSNSYDPRVPNRLHLIARNTTWGSELFLTYDTEFDFGRKIDEACSYVDVMLPTGQYIYLFQQKNMVDIFDIIEVAWLERHAPRMPSIDGWTVTLREKLYHIDFGDIFVYKFGRNRFESITRAPDFFIQGVVALKNQIFIVGHHDDDDIMMCQGFDPENNTWISPPAPNIFRTMFLLVAYHEQVFLIPAHHYRENHLNMVEVYDPNQNAWISLPELPFRYRCAEAVIVDDKIFVYENIEEDKRKHQKVVDPPVYWDESDHLWRIVDESSPWFHIERYSVLPLEDRRIVKHLTAKNKCLDNEWERNFLV